MLPVPLESRRELLDPVPGWCVDPLEVGFVIPPPLTGLGLVADGWRTTAPPPEPKPEPDAAVLPPPLLVAPGWPATACRTTR